VAEKEATEDIQKFGGMEALEEPYMRIRFGAWCVNAPAGSSFCFWGNVDARQQWQITRRTGEGVVLACSCPSLVSSGGNLDHKLRL